jgi:hypothetical protein
MKVEKFAPSLLSTFWKIWKKTTETGYLRSVRVWKNILRSLFNPVRLVQVNISIKSSKIDPTGSLIHLLACFGQKIEEKFFKGTTMP